MIDRLLNCDCSDCPKKSFYSLFPLICINAFYGQDIKYRIRVVCTAPLYLATPAATHPLDQNHIAVSTMESGVAVGHPGDVNLLTSTSRTATLPPDVFYVLTTFRRRAAAGLGHPAVPRRWRCRGERCSHAGPHGRGDHRVCAGRLTRPVQPACWGWHGVTA